LELSNLHPSQIAKFRTKDYAGGVLIPAVRIAATCRHYAARSFKFDRICKFWGYRTNPLREQLEIWQRTNGVCSSCKISQ